MRKTYKRKPGPKPKPRALVKKPVAIMFDSGDIRTMDEYAEAMGESRCGVIRRAFAEFKRRVAEDPTLLDSKSNGRSRKRAPRPSTRAVLAA